MAIEQSATASPPSETRSPGPGILLVEDEPQLRDLIAGFLSSRDFTVFAAETGPEALEIWRENRDRGKIGILFTDIVLPGGMTGIEVAERILDDDPRLPVVITSGYRLDSISNAEKIRKLGYFVPKPYSPATIINLFREILKQ